MSIAHIFLDEFGTPELNTNKAGVTPYFVYTGVVIEESELDNARNVHSNIVKTHFGGTHMKSKNIGNDSKGHSKQMKILSELSRINHYVIALLVDKSKIDSIGLTYKKSFIKFFNNLISQQVVGKHDEYHIHLDKLGWKQFQDELMLYMSAKGHGRNLFSNNTFDLQDDITEEPLIQIADFYSGCVGRYYCGTSNKNQGEAVNNIVKSHLFIDWFPREFVNYFGASSFRSDDFNPLIADIALKSANNYLDTASDEIGCEIVKLIIQETIVNPLRFVSSNEIKKKITAKGLKINDAITEISKIRDKGVLIVSPIGKKGYKLPSNEKEIAEFYDRMASNVIPQLKRGHILHRVLVEQSFSAHNILARESYALLNSLIETTVNHRISE